MTLWDRIKDSFNDLDLNERLSDTFKDTEYWRKATMVALVSSVGLATVYSMFTKSGADLSSDFLQEDGIEQSEERESTVTPRPGRDSLQALIDAAIGDVKCPIQNADMYITTYPGEDRGTYIHYSIDIQTPKLKDEPILSPENGAIVSETGTGWSGGRGNYVNLEGNKYQHNLLHLDKILVQEGDTVNQGDTVGFMGKTGRVRGMTGIHLDWKVTDLENDQAINPLTIIPEVERLALETNPKNLGVAGQRYASSSKRDRTRVVRKIRKTYDPKTAKAESKSKRQIQPIERRERLTWDPGRTVQAPEYIESEQFTYKTPRPIEAIHLFSGHGPGDGGFHHNDLHEWELNAKVTDKIVQLMKSDRTFKDVKIIYHNQTHDSSFNDVNKRAKAIDKTIEIEQLDPGQNIALFVHFNDSPNNKSAKGASVLFHDKLNKYGGRVNTKDLAACVLDEIDDQMGKFGKGVYSDKEMQGKENGIFVLKNTYNLFPEMPAIMIEGGFAQGDFEKLKQIQKNPDEYARNVVDGIKEFMQGKTFHKLKPKPQSVAKAKSTNQGGRKYTAKEENMGMFRNKNDWVPYVHEVHRKINSPFHVEKLISNLYAESSGNKNAYKARDPITESVGISQAKKTTFEDWKKRHPTSKLTWNKVKNNWQSNIQFYVSNMKDWYQMYGGTENALARHHGCYDNTNKRILETPRCNKSLGRNAEFYGDYLEYLGKAAPTTNYAVNTESSTPKDRPGRRPRKTWNPFN